MTPPLRVDRVVVREIRVPLVRPFEIASGAVEQRRILLLELIHPDGVRVWSECVAGEAPDYSPETVDTARLALRRWLVPRLLDVELAHPAEAFDRLRRGVRGHGMAAAALEMGCWALSAELTGRRLSEVLGGRRSRIQTGVTLTLAASPDELVAEAREALAQGYRKIKVKIAPGRDVERLRALRRELGEGAPIAADANGSYRRGRLDRLDLLDEVGLLALEQPFAPDDLLGHACLQKRLQTPVALDESVTGFAPAQDMVWLESGRALNLKPGRVGGFAPSLAIEGLCRRAEVPMWCGGMLETGLGRAYNAALAALPGFEMPSDIYPPGRYLVEDIVNPGWTTAPDGTIGVPNRGAGLGVDVDRDRVENLTAWKEEL